MADELEVLTTDRLVVRALGHDDAEAVAGYRSHPEVARHQSWDDTYSLEDAERLIDSVLGRAVGTVGWTQLGIERRDDGRLIGDIGVNGRPRRTAEIGYTLARPEWGHGYATEAVGAVVDLLLGPLRMGSVAADVEPANGPSLAVLERLGFTFESDLADGCRRYRRFPTVTP